MWIEEDEEKQKLIEGYKASLKSVTMNHTIWLLINEQLVVYLITAPFHANTTILELAAVLSGVVVSTSMV